MHAPAHSGGVWLFWEQPKLTACCAGNGGGGEPTLPMQLSFCTSYPGGQMQRKEPSRFWQVPGEQVPGRLTHSLMSAEEGKQPAIAAVLSLEDLGAGYLTAPRPYLQLHPALPKRCKGSR